MSRRRYTLDDLQEYAKRFGGNCLSKEYINESTPIKWRCEVGHNWEARFQIVKQGGWCSQCLKHRKKEQILEDIKEIVSKKGFECLSKEYINDSTKLEFKCSQGHIWLARPNSIKKGSGCRKCADIASGLKKRDTLSTFQKIAVKHGGKCLSTQYTLNYDLLEFQCAKGHVWKTKAANVKNNRWCPLCANTNRQNNHRDSIELYQKIAKERGGVCLSTEYINGQEKLSFQCSEKHVWSARAVDVKRGRWCKICGYKKGGKKGRDSIETFYRIAEERGGKCLSTEYITCDTELLFRCAKNHQWVTKAKTIKKGRWCPTCGHEKVKERLRDSIEKYQEIAKNKGGHLISDKYENINLLLLWECGKGHQWKSNVRTVVYQNKWCPYCV